VAGHPSPLSFAALVIMSHHRPAAKPLCADICHEAVKCAAAVRTPAAGESQQPVRSGLKGSGLIYRRSLWGGVGIGSVGASGLGSINPAIRASLGARAPVVVSGCTVMCGAITAREEANR